MERAGTGGALFRNFYRDFLQESSEILDSTALREAHVNFQAIAQQWTAVSELFHEAGETSDIKHINRASEILLTISEQEKLTMQNLQAACAP